MDVYWLERTESDVPALDEWLSERERSSLRRMTFAKRKTDWRLGRWTAKQATAAHLKLPSDAEALKGIEIIAASSGAPEVFLCGQQVGLTISLSHRAGTAMCVVTSSEIDLGCDLEVIESHSDAFLADYFTQREQALAQHLPAQERLLLVALMWSAKESALKAIRMGLGLDTRSMEVQLPDARLLAEPDSARQPRLDLVPSDRSAAWHPLEVFGETQAFSGWWQQAGPMVRSVVSAGSTPSFEPQHLGI